jgi:hypothetical protein
MSFQPLDRWVKVALATIALGALGVAFSAGRAIRHGFDAGDWALMVLFYMAGSFIISWLAFRE